MEVNAEPKSRFVDHPAPSFGMLAMITAVIPVLIVAISALWQDASAPAIVQIGATAIAVVVLGISLFFLWPLFATYYIVDADGITVNYGPWTRSYPWSDFQAAYWRRGVFATKVGWPSITPCVRMSDGIVLKRKTRHWGLYVTPNDTRAFIEKIRLFAPELTDEMIL